ncbi:MAG: DEAD/DEAH box helicase family protein [Candidatus Saccharibacteria bacterium]
MFKLAQYQEDAVNNLMDAFRLLLRTSHEDLKIVFKSPTGSGKTIMAAELLKRLAFEDMPGNYVFIWASMYKLHSQSREKLAAYLADSRYNLIGLEDLTADALPENTVLFTNWESVTKTVRATGEWANRAVRKGEDSRNIVDVLEATKAEGKEVILIVDEAHQTYLGANSQFLVATVIKPRLTLEVSATPILKPSDNDIANNKARKVIVPFEDVVSSGLIKQEVRINYQIDKHLDAHSSDEAMIEAALERKTILEKQYKEEESEVKPLILIQLPTEESEKTSVLDTSTRVKIEDYLASKDITYNNGKLAIWLSEEKRNKERIEEDDSPVEVLIFKKAIATGWDCPRAQILVMFHEMKSVTFKIQTVGRIMRMPEVHHYKNIDLNSAYVYTNLGSIIIDPNDGDAKAFFRTKYAKIRPFLKNIELPSVYMHRTDFHDLTAAFRPIIFRLLDSRFGLKDGDSKEVVYKKLDNDLELYPEELLKPILSDVTIKNLDDIDQNNIKTMLSTEDSANVEHSFRYALKGWSAPYNFTRSIERLKPALYDWFKKAGYGRDKIDEIQRILVCSRKNQDIFTSIIQEAKTEFEGGRHKDIESKRSRTDFTFKIPEIDQFGENYTMTPNDKHALEPYFAHDSCPNTEKYFESIIDKSARVEWWYKNGEKMQHYFAVPFLALDEETGIQTPASFYPDYVIRYKDGSIGIYDTKQGSTITSNDTKLKSDALQSYIKEQQEKGLDISGGIIDVRLDKSLFICEDLDYSATDKDKWERFSI